MQQKSTDRISRSRKPAPCLSPRSGAGWSLTQPWVLLGLQIKKQFMSKDCSNEERERGWVACRLSKSFPTSEAYPPSSLRHPSEVSETFEKLLEKEVPLPLEQAEG